MHETDHKLSAAGALGRALVAAIIMGVALGIVGLIAGLYGITAGPAHPLATRLLVAAPVALFVVGLIVLLRRRLDRLPLAGIGFTGAAAGLRGFLQGAGIVLGSGSLVLLVLVLFGGASVSDLDAGALLGFLFTNAIVAILFEAIPEETAIRGYALTSLRRRFGPLLAGTLNIATFLVVPIVAGVTTFVLARLVGAGGQLQLVPGGDDPITYFVMLTSFGLMLIYARNATRSRTIWTGIGAHVAWLTVNRIVLTGNSSLNVQMGDAGVPLFFGCYMALAIIAFSLLGEARHAKVVAR